MNVLSNQYLSIEQVKDRLLSTAGRNNDIADESGVSFQSILDSKTEKTLTTGSGSEIRFSKHATSRLATRDITLNDDQVARLNDGVQKANEKGIKDSLMIMDRLAFIVNVPSATVITAMDQTETNNNIFTNIDGAVIV
ncbi:MAG: flagellar protein [Lachnospiraceae bacterium]|nr:flagellar protein [Lachnospiraceae bacterium]